MGNLYYMTKIEEVLKRRAAEQSRIRMQLNSVRAEEEALLKGGEDTVAWVKEELCIGCDQCTIVCEDDAIELYDTPLLSPIMNVCLLYTSPSPRDRTRSRMPSSA